MKKIVSCIIFLSMIFSLACTVSAAELHASHDDYSTKIWEKEIIVEVTCEEDTYTYPMNPNYRYTFIWVSPSKTRAVCWSCGRSTMGISNVKRQYDSDGKPCPIAPAGLYSDIFNEWHTYTCEKCTSCGAQGEYLNSSNPVVSYTARCYNDDNPSENGEWEVKAEYTMANGYNPHQCLSWWLNGILE